MKIIELDSIDSTNEYCKSNDTGEDLLVFAACQTAGRGTKGRSFSSGEGGLYYSVMRHYENFPARNAFKIMINSCVAVCETLKKSGINPTIRWANDVLVGGRKISGTLIENTFSGDKITRSIVGTGVNINNTFPPELKDIAVSAGEYLGRYIRLEQVKSDIISAISKNYGIADYLRYIDWLGTSVKISTAEGEFTAIAEGIEEDGRLIVNRDGERIKISAGEVTLRL